MIVQLGIDATADEQFKSSDWVPQENKKMLDSIRHLETPYGTLGDLFDVTPIERVSKVYFEDQLFKTWNDGRTVLIGDGTYLFVFMIFLISMHCRYFSKHSLI